MSAAGFVERRDRMDAAGAAALTAMAALFGFNQVVIKLVNAGIQPAFAAGLRSGLALMCLLVWMRWTGQRARLTRDLLLPGLFVGFAFTGEFLCLFVSLDLTTVTRSAILFYSMPVWLALGAHLLLPGERIGPARAAGLALAVAGVGWAMLDREAGLAPGVEASLAGDLCALAAALGWAALTLALRLTGLKRATPETQLLWQLAVSAPLLILAAPLFGPLLREPSAAHAAGLVFQAVIVVTAGFVLWFRLLARYPAAGVASFSFLTPVFGIGFGWLVFGDHVGPGTLAAAALVAAGIVLINRPPRASA